MQYGQGDVIRVKAWYSLIPPGSLATFIRYGDSFDICFVEYGGMWHLVNMKHTALYRRHIDSPLRKQDDKRFWKLNPPPKRAKGAK